MTLTEFLLARIAEDEAYLEAVEDGMYALDDYPPSLSALQSAERFRAEVESRRAIANGYRMALDRVAESASVARVAAAETLELVVRFLALPYADHPDYCEEWKPLPPRPSRRRPSL